MPRKRMLRLLAALLGGCLLWNIWGGAAFAYAQSPQPGQAEQTGEASGKAAPSAAAAQNDLSNTDVRLDPEKVITENFIGLGFEWDGYAHADSEEPSEHGWGFVMSEEDWDTVLQRVSYMRPQFIRVMLKSEWWYRDGVDENGNPSLNFASQEMQIVCDKIFDYCQENGVTVMFGEWDPDGNPNWGWSLAECVEYLVVERGYTCIKYINVQNCVRNNEMETWRGYVRNLYDELELRGLLGQVEIVGPDDQINNPESPTSNFLQRVVDDPELSGMLGAYESHHYTPYQEQIESMVAYIAENEEENKPFLIGETGIMPKYTGGVPNTGADSNAHVYDYSYGLDMSQYTAAMVNGGAAAISVWDLDDATHWGSADEPRKVRRWGFWNILGEEMYNDPADEEIRPWFYPYALMTRNFPRGSIILDTESVDTNDIQTMAALVPQEDGTYGITLVGINRSNEDQTITFRLPQAGGLVDLSEYHYFDGDRLVDENGFPAATDVRRGVNLSQGVTMTVKANGVAFLLSLEAESSFALGQSLPEPEPYYQTSPADQILVDNSDAGFSSSGNWQATCQKVGWIGENYLEDGTDGADGEDVWCRWTPQLDKAGYYDVYLSWPRGRDKAASYLPVTVHSADGADYRTLDQKANDEGTWHKVGTYRFEAGEDGFVQLSARGYGRTAADAARFVYRGTEAPPEEPEYQVILTHYDNGSPDIVKTGEWRQSSLRGYPDKYSAYFASDGNTGKGTKQYTFSPMLEYGGVYRVEIFYPTGNGNFATNVPVDVADAEGNVTTVTVDQSRGGGQWNSLGTFTFEKGRKGSATIRTDGTDGTVIANAMRFVLVEKEEDPNQGYNRIDDELESWDFLYDRSSNLMFEEPKTSEYDDGSRIKRTGASENDDVPAELVYAYSGLRNVELITYMNDGTYSGEQQSVLAYSSSDGYTWQPCELVVEDLGQMTTHWKYKFTLREEFPENTNYLKIVLQNYQPVFYPQVGRVTLYTEPAASAACLSVNLQETLVSVNVGSTYGLVPYFGPADAQTPDVTFSSSDPSVAVVDEDGTVTALKEGSATITVETDNGHRDAAVFYVTPVNLALHKAVWGSKTSSSEFSPECAVDGDPGTRWSTGNTEAASFKVNLGEVQEISEVKIVWAGSAGSDMTIEVTDQEAEASEKDKWTTVASFTGLTQSNYTQTIRFDPVQAGSLLIRAPKTTSKYGLGIYEVEIYGSGGYLPVESVSAPETMEALVGDTLEPNIQVLPADATYRDVVYTYSDSHVVNLVDGELRAVSPGECIVTATADGVSTEIRIRVEPRPDPPAIQPIQTVETKDGPVVISIADAQAGAIPAGTRLAAGDDYENSKDILINGYTVEMAFALQLLTEDDSPVPPQGTIQVTMQLPDGCQLGEQEEIAVFMPDEEGIPVKLSPQTTQEEGRCTVTFRTDRMGQFLLAKLDEGPQVLAGDLDKDGEVTITDVMAACRILARKNAGQNPVGDQLLRGDLDGDGDVSINDIMEICRLLARQS